MNTFFIRILRYVSMDVLTEPFLSGALARAPKTVLDLGFHTQN